MVFANHSSFLTKQHILEYEVLMKRDKASSIGTHGDLYLKPTKCR